MPDNIFTNFSFFGRTSRRTGQALERLVTNPAAGSGLIVVGGIAAVEVNAMGLRRIGIPAPSVVETIAPVVRDPGGTAVNIIMAPASAMGSTTMRVANAPIVRDTVGTAVNTGTNFVNAHVNGFRAVTNFFGF